RRADAGRRQGARPADRQASPDRHAPHHRSRGRRAGGADRPGARDRDARVHEGAPHRGRLGGDPGVLRQARGTVQGEVGRVDLGIRDRVALVTGGARSLGKADALLLAAEGCRVAIVDLNAEGAEETASEITAAGGRARGYTCDIREAAAVAAVVADVERDLGPVDICVNNAGFIYTVAQLKDMRDDD